MIYKAVIGFLLIMIAYTGARELFSEKPKHDYDAVTTLSEPKAVAPDAPAVLEAKLRTAVRDMSNKEAETFFRIELEKTCQATDRHLNFIKVEKRGQGLYCVHELYTELSLAAGPRGPALERFASKWGNELKQHKLTRIGVWGSNKSNGGAWLEIN